jgi:hypothetical protein
MWAFYRAVAPTKDASSISKTTVRCAQHIRTSNCQFRKMRRDYIVTYRPPRAARLSNCLFVTSRLPHGLISAQMQLSVSRALRPPDDHIGYATGGGVTDAVALAIARLQ